MNVFLNNGTLEWHIFTINIQQHNLACFTEHQIVVKINVKFNGFPKDIDDFPFIMHIHEKDKYINLFM